jgi:hypothetical protein
MYGLMTTLPNRGDLETLVKGAFDRLMRYSPDEEIAVGKPNGASAHAPRVLSS